jgi:hypothetical protein
MTQRNIFKSIISSTICLALLISLAIPSTALAITLSSVAPQLTVTVQDGPQASLQWDFPYKVRISGFQVERSLDPTSGYTTVGDVGRRDSAYLDQAVQEGQGYYYRVRAYKSGKTTGYSQYSNIDFADIPVTVPVDTAPPSVSLTSPSANAVFASEQVVNLTADAFDDIGIDRVDFFCNDIIVGSDNTAPYSAGWAVAQNDNGQHSLKAKAFDKAGKEAVSSSMAVTVDIAPPVQTIPGSFEFASANYNVNESNGNVSITINRVGGSDGVATVDWKTQGVTATYAQDYGNFDWTILTFADGETSKTEVVGIVDDTTEEANETFNVLLGNPTSGATLGSTTTSVVTITDNDQAIPVPGSFEFAAGSYSVDENAGNVSITINRVGGSDGVATVDWMTQGVTATYAQDYNNFSWTTLTFVDGETSKTEVVGIVDDTTEEANETFNVLLGNPTAGSSLGALTTSSVTIVDNDAPVLPAEYTAPVLNSVEVSGNDFILSWSLPQTSYGEPSGGYDIFIDQVDTNEQHRTTAYSTVISGLSTDVEHCFRVQSRWLQAEPDQTPASNFLCGTIVGEPTPTPDPIPGSFEFATAGYNVNENAGTVSITINRVGGSDGVVTVDWMTQGVTATYAQDYSNFSWTTLTFADGETSKTQVVGIVDDSIEEADETFNVLLGNPTAGSSLGALSSASVSIIDNDAPVLPAEYTVPVLNSVDVSGSDFVLSWSLPQSTYGEPSGGFDVVIDGVDTNEQYRTTQYSTVISGLSANVDHCFKAQARWLQAEPDQTPNSNQLCGIIESSTTPPPSNGTLTVFPGAEGFGVETPAGRGGSIIKVTNLNDSGPGSFRAALDASGRRIVVFEVGGMIDLSTRLQIYNPFLTIAGQTAPSPGITLKGAGIEIRTHDVLMQHIRMRTGDAPGGPSGEDRDAFNVLGPDTYNVVVDHVSASWGVDENGSTWYEEHDITVSNSIIAESLHNSIHPKGAHGKGFLVGDYTTNVSLIGNLLAHNDDRNPRIKGTAQALVLNNVMYNNKSQMVIGSPDGPALVSAIGNVFIDGPSSPWNRKMIEVYPANSAAGTQVYQTDNAYVGNQGGAVWGYATSFDPSVSSPPVWKDGLTVRPSSTVETRVLNNAGARPADRDSIDIRIVDEVRSRSGRIIDSQTEVGGWAPVSDTYRPFIVPSNPNGDDDADGYTNIEEMLHQMASDVEGGSV